MKGEIVKCKDWNKRKFVGTEFYKYWRNYDGSLRKTGWAAHCPACKDHLFWTRTKREAQEQFIRCYQKEGVL